MHEMQRKNTFAGWKWWQKSLTGWLSGHRPTNQRQPQQQQRHEGAAAVKYNDRSTNNKNNSTIRK